MERKVSFAVGEHYHIFSRGVEKRKIFLEKKDYERFVALLYILNQEDAFLLSNFLKNHQLFEIYDFNKNNTLVSIISYCLMPNHFHLLLHENKEGGISKFLSRVLTGYSMYFNKKNNRSGPLFVHPFRSEHIENNPHYLHMLAYIHLNPISLIQNNWKESGISNIQKTTDFLVGYKYSSYIDYEGLKRPESKIIDCSFIEKFIPENLRTTLDISEYQKQYKQYGK